ncbi:MULTISPECIES: alpha/beta fold hydrolase [unclassified Synechocystis]|uniref:alpha/beta fold hydrolase n=1 Tax=unclassified Synechocystis TaxID=2640012 RepID=UPI000418D9C5|nr:MULTISPECIES: alpha/beta fold hydrolase [unclassified Synechocystis]AIE74334.1 putative alpha/beta hydrolase superfamily [Synechocystis sp. PCC 6714]MCT0254886.1 alpha/beta fold hydrolase [Synechocystis sp. CS-94]
MTNRENGWNIRIGCQREWIWRGWQIRYSFCHPSQPIGLPPLLLIHGFGAAIEHWRHNVSFFAQHTSVYAIDLLGFGGSRKANTLYSAYGWAEQVEDFCQQIIGCPTVLVGNSIGSLVALTVAGQSPALVAGLIMASLPDVSLRQQGAPRFLRPWIEKLENAFSPPWLLDSLFKLVRRPAIIKRWASLAYGSQTEQLDLDNFNRELVQIICLPPQDLGAEIAFRQLFSSVRLPHFAPSVKEVLPSLNLPILLLWGEGDRFVPYRYGQKFASFNKRIEFQLWAGAGHCLHDECPNKFNQTCLTWLKQNFSKSLEMVEPVVTTEKSH